MKNSSIYLLLAGYCVIAIFTLFHFNGTGDAGDSTNHYFFAGYAPDHPQLYFEHHKFPSAKSGPVLATVS